MNREQGYYWVKTKKEKWHVAFWNHELGYKYYWTVCWHKFSMKDNDFIQINENQIKPSIKK